MDSFKMGLTILYEFILVDIDSIILAHVQDSKDDFILKN